MTLKQLMKLKTEDLYVYLKEELDNVREDKEKIKKDRVKIKKFLFFTYKKYKDVGVIENPKSLFMIKNQGEYSCTEWYSNIDWYLSELSSLIDDINKIYLIENKFNYYCETKMKEFILENTLFDDCIIGDVVMENLKGENNV